MPLWSRRDQPPPDDSLQLIVGLGNPGRQYAETRHNIGFLVVDELARMHDLSLRGSKQRADVARGVIEGVPVLLAQPVTYMNESGNAVQKLMQYYRVDVSRLLVVCDDIDLPFGTIRLRLRGSSGGQRGLESIIRSLGTNDFARLKLGVGRPAHGAIDHVLGRFPADQAAVLPRLLRIAAGAVESYLVRDPADVMNEVNRDWLPELSVSPDRG